MSLGPLARAQTIATVQLLGWPVPLVSSGLVTVTKSEIMHSRELTTPISGPYSCNTLDVSDQVYLYM